MRGELAPTADTTATLKKDTAKRACCRVRSRISQPLRPAGAGRPLTRRPTLETLSIGSCLPSDQDSTSPDRRKLCLQCGQVVPAKRREPGFGAGVQRNHHNGARLFGGAFPCPTSKPYQRENNLTMFHVEHQPLSASTSPSDTPSGRSVETHCPVAVSYRRMSPFDGVPGVTSFRTDRPPSKPTVCVAAS